MRDCAELRHRVEIIPLYSQTSNISTHPPIPTYNTIGDIHGRDTRKRLVDEDCINIFLGDYFDPYLDFTIEELEWNFIEFIEYKRKHTVLQGDMLLALALDKLNPASF